MANEFDELGKVPSLSFGMEEEAPAETAPVDETPVVTETPAQAAAAAAAEGVDLAAPAGNVAAAVAQEVVEDVQAAPLNDSILTDEEREQVEQFSHQIDVHNTQAILQYGAGAQKKMADFSTKALENVRTKDMGEVGGMITTLVTELNGFDADEEAKGILGFFKKPVDKLTAMKTKYDKAEVNVDKISKALEDHQVTLIKDIATLDKMYDLNLVYFKELTMYILAGKKKLQDVRSNELKALTEKAEKSGLAEDAQAAKDLDSLCERFEKKLYDLELTRQVALQTAPQIRLVQDSNEVMVEKIQSTLVNTIPLWKNQMVIALGVQHSNEAAKAQQAVTNVTNELLKKNAEKLKMASIETAKQAERGIVDLETLKATNASLISTLDEVVKIQSEGKAKRAAAEAEMAQMELNLKNKLVEMSKD